MSSVLANLTDRDRDLLMLRFGYGWTDAEIAAAVSLSRVRVSQLVAAALRKVGVTTRPKDRRKVRLRTIRKSLADDL